MIRVFVGFVVNGELKSIQNYRFFTIFLEMFHVKNFS